MIKNSQKIKFFFSVLFFLFLPFFTFALILQQNYPRLNLGIGTFELTNTTQLHQLLLYFYYFLIIIGGFATFLGIITGGFLFLSSAGNPGKINEAKSQLLASFLGIILLLSSWIILNRIDPSLVAFHTFPASIEFVGEQERIRPPEVEDGFVIYTTHPDFPAIPYPKGLGPVEDTARFPVGGRTINLSGVDIGGGIRRIERIEFFNPVVLDILCEDQDNDGIPDPDIPGLTPGSGRCCERDRNGNPIMDRCCDVIIDQTTGDVNIIQGTCDVAYYYGVICFSEPNFQGMAQVITSYNTTEHNLFPLFADQGFPQRPCRSLYTFKQPAISIYTPGDQVLFFEEDSPVDKDPETGAVIGGACIKIDTHREPERCEDEGLRYLNVLEENYESVEGIFSIPSLCGMTRIRDENNNVIDEHSWFPRSLDLIVDRDKKYLVLLFQGGEDCNGNNVGPTPHTRGPFRGNTYRIDRDVPDFLDPSDPRLYWIRTGQDPLPRSAQILPFEPIE